MGLLIAHSPSRFSLDKKKSFSFSRRVRWLCTATILVLCSLTYVLAYRDSFQEKIHPQSKSTQSLTSNVKTKPDLGLFRIGGEKGKGVNGTPLSKGASSGEKGTKRNGTFKETAPKLNDKRLNAPITFVSAASTNHACELKNLALSIHEAGKDVPANLRPRMVAYDLGNNETDREEFAELSRRGVIHELYTFDYSNYPAHVQMDHHRGHYSWKPLIISEVIRRTRTGIVIWLDAGCLVENKDFFDSMRRSMMIRSTDSGFWSPTSPGSMGEWTHPDMFRYFGEDPGDFYEKPNCNGALVAFDAQDVNVWENIVLPWTQCALVENCIAPNGSSRENHRQDQSVLSYLVQSRGYTCGEDAEPLSSVKLHMDQLCGPPMTEWE